MGGELRGILEEVVWVMSDKDNHFTGSVVQNAKEDESLAKDVEGKSLNYSEWEVTQVIILSDQQLHFELYFWSSADYDDTDPDADAFLGSVDLDLAVSGKQIDAAGLWRMDVELSPRIRIVDLDDNSKSIHMSLVNRSVAAKNAGSTGEVVVKLALAPRR